MNVIIDIECNLNIIEHAHRKVRHLGSLKAKTAIPDNASLN